MQAKTRGSHSFSAQQPAVIPVFFATEMWERFGAYMVQVLLVLYMTSKVFGFSDAKSYAILGVFSAISWITPIFGGYVASRVLDFEHSVILGGFLLSGGYALLSLPPTEHFFYVALAIITIGNGFFKPNISSYLGDFYHVEDPYREEGYTIFYVGINVGALLATATSGYLARYFGWHVTFVLASVGLLVGVTTFILGLYYLKRTKRFHRIKPSIASKKPLLILAVYASALILGIISFLMIRHRGFGNQIMLSGAIIIFAGLTLRAFRYQTMARNKMLACIFLTILSIVFWAVFFQMFFSMNLFIERAVDRHIFNFTLPTPLFASLESIFIVLLGPCFAILWLKLSNKNKNPSIPMKFTLSMFGLMLCFLIAYVGTKFTGTNGLSSMLFIVFAYLFLTVGELLLSPVGLAMVTMYVPQELVGLMMGVWFVALGLGEKLAGVIAGYAAIPKDIHAITTINQIYGHAFLLYAGLSLACGIICWACVPFLNKLIQTK